MGGVDSDGERNVCWRWRRSPARDGGIDAVFIAVANLIPSVAAAANTCIVRWTINPRGEVPSN
jgi:hypothetical protein